MSGIHDRLNEIRAKAAGQPPPARPDPPPAAPDLSQQKATILRALEAGSQTGALALALQAVGGDDPAFMEKARQLLQHSDPGEAWRMAFKAYEKYAPQLVEAAGSADPSAAVAVFQEAGRICALIYNGGSVIAQAVSMAVFEALEKTYKEASEEKRA